MCLFLTFSCLCPISVLCFALGSVSHFLSLFPLPSMYICSLAPNCCLILKDSGWLGWGCFIWYTLPLLDLWDPTFGSWPQPLVITVARPSDPPVKGQFGQDSTQEPCRFSYSATSRAYKLILVLSLPLFPHHSPGVGKEPTRFLGHCETCWQPVSQSRFFFLKFFYFLFFFL